MGGMGGHGSNHLDSTYPYQLPHPLLGGVPGRAGWVGQGGCGIIPGFFNQILIP
jgi:hypothetical protein